MACKAAVGVVAGTQTVGIGHGLREVRIDLRTSRHERRSYGIAVAYTERCHRAGIADGFQLARTLDALEKQRELDGAHREVLVVRVRADEWWMGNGNALRLQSASGVVQPPSNTG